MRRSALFVPLAMLLGSAGAAEVGLAVATTPVAALSAGAPSAGPAASSTAAPPPPAFAAIVPPVVAPPLERAAPPKPISAGSSPASGPHTVTLNFQNADLDVVLSFFSQITGKVFVKSDQVRGFVSVLSPGPVTTDEALSILQAVLEVKGFTLVQGRDDIVKVMSQAEAAQTDLDVVYGAESIDGPADRMVTQVVPLRFVSATDLKTSLTPLLSKGGNLIADERVNSIVITDMASNVSRLLKMIANLDVRTPQVLIEALIVELSLTNETKLGFEWSYQDRFSASGHGFDQNAGQSFNLGDLVTEGIKYSLLRDDGRLSGLMQMLATDKDVNILSTPHILAMNNQPAVIRVGEEVPVLTQTRNVEGGDTIRSFDFKDVSIELEVTPRINVDRDVFLKVHPTVKSILGFNAELNAPILGTREAQTSVLLRDGETIVIGGLMKDDRSSSQSKVPILGDIPILGAFFKSLDKSDEKTELLVFITPRVVTNGDEARALTIRKESESRSLQTPYRQDARADYRLGRFFYGQKRYAEAALAFERAAASSPDDSLRRKAQRFADRARKRVATNPPPPAP